MTRWVVPVTRGAAVVVTGTLAVFAVRALRSQGPAGTKIQPDTVIDLNYEAPVDVDTASLAGPRQPIFYRHDVHAGQYRMDCRYCHYNVERSPSPGLPSLASCMGCHLIVGSGNPEVQKLRDAVAAKQPVEWVEVHRLSQFVHFSHARHVVAGELNCKECHGQVNRMPQVYQFASLKMGWCIACHKSKEYKGQPGRPVTTDCSACHY